MKLLLIGPQGSGKGRIGDLLSNKLGMPYISLGALFRDIPASHPDYIRAKEAMDRGELVPDDIAGRVFSERIHKEDCLQGYIFDGWVRKIDQVRIFDPKPDTVIVLNISRETSIKRITGRRMCDTDDRVYNVFTLPKEELEKCKGNLIQRDDDTEESVNRRLDIYYTETVEVIEYYRQKGVVVEIDAEPLPDEIFSNIVLALGLN